MFFLFKEQRLANVIRRIPKSGLLFFDQVVDAALILEGVSLHQVPEHRRIMHISILDAHQQLLMGETVKVIVQFAIVRMEVNVKLRLE
jgi:hypothetical protein